MEAITRTTTCNRCHCSFEYETIESALVARFKPAICASCAAEGRAKDAVRFARQAAEAAIAEQVRRNVPARYAEASVDNFVAGTKAQARAAEVVRSGKAARDGLLMQGASGCGKTHLAAAAVNAGPVGGLFVATTELLDDIRRGYDGGGRGLYDRALAAPLLALDDLGQESVTDWVRDRLYTLVNHRWNDVLPLIVTTNHSPGELQARVGQGTTSRVIGLCAHRLIVQGEDGRKAVPG